MPLAPRGASYYTDVVKSSAEINAAITGAVSRGGNAVPPRPAGAVASIVKNNIIAQIQFQALDNMPGPAGPPGPQGLQGPTGPAGPPGSGGGGSYTALNVDIWGGSPPTSAEEAINRLAALLYIRTYTQGKLTPLPNNARVFSLESAGSSDAFVVKYATDGTPQWVRRIGGTGADQGMGIAVDSSGNVYVTGYCTGTGTVFAADGTTSAFSIVGGGETFVVKYSTDGTPQWARRIRGGNGLGISIDSSGNVYVTGGSSSVATVFAADGTTTAFSLANAGSSDAFIVKYTTDGTPVWARRIGGAGTDPGTGVAVDSSGNAYITGYAGSANVFDNQPNAIYFTSTSSGGNDVFVVKYATDGTPQWLRRIGGTSDDSGLSVSTDSSGNMYVTGLTGATATVFAADGTTTAFSLANAGSSDAFVVKYATDGTPQWARRIGGTGADQGTGIAVDSSGNAYITGYCTGTGTVFAADGTTTAFSLASTGSSDAFVVKYNTSGTPQWVRRIGGTGADQGMGIAVDSSGNAYITGYCTGTGTVFAADGTTTAFSLANAGSSDVFIVKYATDGTPQWVRRIGGTGADQGMGIAVDSSGNAYITGYCTGTALIVNF